MLRIARRKTWLVPVAGHYRQADDEEITHGESKESKCKYVLHSEVSERVDLTQPLSLPLLQLAPYERARLTLDGISYYPNTASG